jgi:hypothetical protein
MNNGINKDELERKLRYCKKRLQQFTDRDNEMIRIAQEEARNLKPHHNIKNETTVLNYWAGIEIGMLKGKISLLEDILFDLDNNKEV